MFIDEPKAVSNLTRPILGLMLGGALVVLCYYFVDRPVARFVHDHRLLSDQYDRWPPRISDWTSYAVIAGIVVVAAWRIVRRGGSAQALLVAISANLVATAAIKCGLKWAFGRAWPETWIHGNPSLIANGIYGFHPFDCSGTYQSFPSGHAAAAFAVLSILWLARPRRRPLYMALGLTACVALVGLNYHFVSDVIAGAMLGTVTGCCATRIFRLRPQTAGHDIE